MPKMAGGQKIRAPNMNVSVHILKFSGGQIYFSTAEQVCAHCDKFACTVNKFLRSVNKFLRSVNKFLRSVNKFLRSVNKFLCSVNKFLRKSICFRAEVKSFCANKNVSASSN